MNVVRMLAIVSLGIVLTAPPAVAQTLSRYRAYALESSLASIAKTSGARDSDLRTLHVRPSRIQELEWRAPYVMPGRAPVDPVRSVVFSFYDDQLYRVVVTYDRDRTEGLTDRDVFDAISATYDALPMQARESDSARADLPANSRVVPFSGRAGRPAAAPSQPASTELQTAGSTSCSVAAAAERSYCGAPPGPVDCCSTSACAAMVTSPSRR